MDGHSGEKVTLPLMTQDETEDLNDFTETGPFVELTSQDAPGSAENGVMHLFPRTVGCLHPSGKAPDREAPRFGDRRHFQDEQLLVPPPIGRTVIEFEWCRQTLKHTIKSCLNLKLDFSYVVSAISCILNSLRPLHTWEVDTAVGLFVEYADTKHPSHDEDEDEDEAARETWLDRCRSFLVVDEAGQVRFASAFMPQFLRQFPIRGIDATHQTIATACLIQVDLDDRPETRALARPMLCLPADSNLVFSGYAEKYWREHCLSAEQSCQDLSTAGSVRPTTGWSVVPRDRAGGMAANADADLDTIRIEHLTLGGDEDDEMDWVVVDKVC